MVDIMLTLTIYKHIFNSCFFFLFILSLGMVRCRYEYIVVVVVVEHYIRIRLPTAALDRMGVFFLASSVTSPNKKKCEVPRSVYFSPSLART